MGGGEGVSIGAISDRRIIQEVGVQCLVRRVGINMSKKVAVQLITLFLLLYTRGVAGKHFFLWSVFEATQIINSFLFYVYSTFASYFFYSSSSSSNVFCFCFYKVRGIRF